MYPVNQKGSPVDLKGGFTGDQVFFGKFFVGNPPDILCNHTDKGIVV